MLALPYKILSLVKDRSMTIDVFGMHRDINGFLYRSKHIAINKNISWYEQRFAICHELSHAVLWHHEEWKIYEREADYCAFGMLVSDDELLELWERYEWDTCMIEKHIWVSHERIQYRLQKLLWKKISSC